ncbi:MAG: hypothetical protein WCG14_07835, partial [Chlamydiia bacterium]
WREAFLSRRRASENNPLERVLVIPLYKERLLPDKKNYPPLTTRRVNRSTSLPASCDHAIGHSKLHKRILLSRE